MSCKVGIKAGVFLLLVKTLKIKSNYSTENKNIYSYANSARYLRTLPKYIPSRYYLDIAIN
jgi:hypothetical protein